VRTFGIPSGAEAGLVMIRGKAQPPTLKMQKRIFFSLRFLGAQTQCAAQPCCAQVERWDD
jgi:hypothetical protein